MLCQALVHGWQPFVVVREERMLVARFSEEREVLSWAIWNGGRRRADAVAWVEVRNAELPVGLDPRELCAERLRMARIPSAVGLLTSRRLDGFHAAAALCDGIEARVVATVGLSNALRVGDEPGPIAPPGTINLLCELSTALTEEGALEALSIVVEARTAAVARAGFPSRRSGQPATGTGTDCVVLAWPVAGAGDSPAIAYSGKHTAAGHVVGQAALAAVSDGVDHWLKEHQCRLG